MIFDAATQPQVNDQLSAQLIAMASALNAAEAALIALNCERDHFKAAYEEAEAERQRLDHILQQLKRAQFGPKSGRLDPDQLQLALENIEQDLATAAAAAEEPAAVGSPAPRRRRAPAARTLGHLPAHLEREEVRIEPEDKTCPCCGGVLHEIDVEKTERLDIIPMKLRVQVYARAKEVLAGYTGVLQVDGWKGFKRLTDQPDAIKANVGPLILAFCWAHGRRDFVAIHQTTKSPIAGEVVRRIAELYRIEDDIRGRPPDERKAVRQDQSKPRVVALKAYVEEQLTRVSGKMPLAKAIRYLLNHWDGLCVFLDDGRVEIDSNTVERRHRVVATARRNSLFAGSDAGARSWAIFTSLIQTARLNDLDPVAYLTDVLERIVSGDVKANDLERLLPWNWKAGRAAQAA